MKKFWVSWYSVTPLSEFELHSPWWISGWADDDIAIVCAAVQAEDVVSAGQLISNSYDNPPMHIEWRFVEERPDDWSPFNDRFPRADWMKWEA